MHGMEVVKYANMYNNQLAMKYHVQKPN